MRKVLRYTTAHIVIQHLLDFIFGILFCITFAFFRYGQFELSESCYNISIDAKWLNAEKFSSNVKQRLPWQQLVENYWTAVKKRSSTAMLLISRVDFLLSFSWKSVSGSLAVEIQ